MLCFCACPVDYASDATAAPTPATAAACDATHLVDGRSLPALARASNVPLHEGTEGRSLNLPPHNAGLGYQEKNATGYYPSPHPAPVPVTPPPLQEARPAPALGTPMCEIPPTCTLRHLVCATSDNFIIIIGMFLPSLPSTFERTLRGVHSQLVGGVGFKVYLRSICANTFVARQG